MLCYGARASLTRPRCNVRKVLTHLTDANVGKNQAHAALEHFGRDLVTRGSIVCASLRTSVRSESWVDANRQGRRGHKCRHSGAHLFSAGRALRPRLLQGPATSHMSSARPYLRRGNPQRPVPGCLAHVSISRPEQMGTPHCYQTSTDRPRKQTTTSAPDPMVLWVFVGRGRQRAHK